MNWYLFLYKFYICFFGTEVQKIPPGDVEHVGVDWNRARLIKGHEEDAVRNLKERGVLSQESREPGNCDQNLGSNPCQLH